jgi:hypothetical protein
VDKYGYEWEKLYARESFIVLYSIYIWNDHKAYGKNGYEVVT